MSRITTYKDLEVWKQSRALASLIYGASNQFPVNEQFGLTSQLRRAAVSVPSNIAEGCGRSTPKDSLRFFFVARGGLYEMETQVLIALDLKYLSEKDCNDLLAKLTNCRRLLNGFINYFQNMDATGAKEPFEEYSRLLDAAGNSQLTTDN